MDCRKCNKSRICLVAGRKSGYCGNFENDTISAVNHPRHYTIPGRKECIVEMEEVFGKAAVITFCNLNAYKYRYRAGMKYGNSMEQDLKKAAWYEEYAEKLKNN